jgi:type IV secretory pathway VirD2 relaxase
LISFGFEWRPEREQKMGGQGYIRHVMLDVAKELKEPDLHWVATNHYDTDQPHAHVLIRGKRANGQALVIPRQIIGHTIREHAQARAQELLGDQSRDQAEKDLFVRARAMLPAATGRPDLKRLDHSTGHGTPTKK